MAMPLIDTGSTNNRNCWSVRKFLDSRPRGEDSFKYLTVSTISRQSEAMVLTSSSESIPDLNALEQHVIDVDDLPQIHTKPSARALLEVLSLLSNDSRLWKIAPPSSRGSSKIDPRRGTITPPQTQHRTVRAAGVPQYLTKIISSRLDWIENDEEREKVWETASVRLSERSGRSAMGAFTRTFSVPLHSTEIGPSGLTHGGVSAIDISIHEPALTSDNLGFKTWAASYVLARNLGAIASYIPSLHRSSQKGGSHSSLVLELGAGTGLVGIAAAATLGVRILLTDLPDISANLARNARDNASLSRNSGAVVSVAVLDWSNPSVVLPIDAVGAPYQEDVAHAADHERGSLDAEVIMAADPIYSREHPTLLVSAIGCHLSKGKSARVILGIPLREAYSRERAMLRDEMHRLGLVIAAEFDDVGLDDWGSDDAPSEVECNITVWRRP